MRKMTMLQADLEKAEDRANAKESKNTELEEELKEVGMNVKSLKVNVITILIMVKIFIPILYNFRKVILLS